jgi:hypothetical protein
MDYYEYFPDSPDSWVTKSAPSRPHWFDRELVSIAGLNRHGKPNLQLVWGGTQVSDKAEDTRLKYHAGWSAREVKGWRYRQGEEWIFTEDIDNLDPSIMVFPDTHQEQLGVPRWIIERWVSPEELEEENRFQVRKEFRETQKVLRDFPREGVYDAYFVVENLQGKFRQVDNDVLSFIRMKWHIEQKPIEEIEKMIEAHDEAEMASMGKREAELWDAALDFDLKLPKEETERREEYWAKRHDYKVELQRMLAMS